jgi:hypothetical protein
MEQTKKRPGRPKAQPAPVAEAVVEQATVKAPEAKKPLPIKRREVVNQNSEYELIRKSGIVYMLPQKGVTVYDEEKDTVRELRYCPNEPSVWRDEQSENATRQSVIFNEGRLFVRKDQPNLRAFMEKHPLNAANGGKMFKLVDKKRDAEVQLKKEFALTDAIAMVRDKEIQDLLPVAMFFGVNINSSVSDIRYNLLQIAKKKTQEFVSAFDSPQVRTRSILQQAADYQIIKLNKDSVKWFDSNSMIVSVPVGQEPLDVMARFCLTEKGAPVLATLEERLERLA